jgi:predicted extracellular nuclease
MARSLALAAIIGLLAVPGAAEAIGSSTITISEVYGGGGNSGAPYANDFVELRNVSSSPVSLSGWSIQYASASGSSWSVTALPAISLAPGRYFLVQEASGGVNGVSLPAPDATGTTAMAATAGKVALVASTVALSGPCPSGRVDLVGYGSATTCFEGSAAAPAPSNTLSDVRGGNGRADSDDNAADFSTAAPAPQNTTSPTAVLLRSFSAARDGGGVVLWWRTAVEQDTVGFDIYRGERRITAAPILAVGATVGHEYMLRDARPGAAPRYRLRELRADGSRAWIGTARPR